MLATLQPGCQVYEKQPSTYILIPRTKYTGLISLASSYFYFSKHHICTKSGGGRRGEGEGERGGGGGEGRGRGEGERGGGEGRGRGEGAQEPGSYRSCHYGEGGGGPGTRVL